MLPQSKRITKGAELRLNTIDAAGVSWYRSLTVSATGKVAPVPFWNSVSPGHEVVSSAAEKSEGGVTVTFTLSPCAWGGTASRRPSWVQFVKGSTPVWPSLPSHKEAYRLNLGALYADRFGRVLR